MDRLQFCAWLLAAPAVVMRPSLGHAQALPAGSKMLTVSAVDTAGRLRMLSQRIVKAYLLLGQGITTDDAKVVFQGSINQFATQLAALQAFQPTATVRTALVKLEGAWANCQTLLTVAPSKEGATALYDANEALQQAAHGATLAYEQVSGSAIDHLVGIAGRQRMLSQRMAKFYFYRTWELFDAPADMELHLSRAHFTAVLIQIDSSQFATARTKAGVTRVRSEWEPYQRVLFASKTPATMRQDAPRVAGLSERVLAVTEELVGLLVAQAQGGPG